jgi:hypothetical protein
LILGDAVITITKTKAYVEVYTATDEYAVEVECRCDEVISAAKKLAVELVQKTLRSLLRYIETEIETAR